MKTLGPALSTLLVLAACASDAPADGDVAPDDTVTATDAATTDTTDVGVPADVASETAQPDVAAPDVADVATVDTSSCDYFDDFVIMACDVGLTNTQRWSDWGDPACPVYWSYAGTEYADLDALAAAQGCDTSCQYVAKNSVSFVTCDGPRSGWEVFEAAGDGCENPVYRTPIGILRDLCLWPDYACYCDR